MVSKTIFRYLVRLISDDEKEIIEINRSNNHYCIVVITI